MYNTRETIRILRCDRFLQTDLVCHWLICLLGWLWSIMSSKIQGCRSCNMMVVFLNRDALCCMLSSNERTQCLWLQCSKWIYSKCVISAREYSPSVTFLAGNIAHQALNTWWEPNTVGEVLALKVEKPGLASGFSIWHFRRNLWLITPNVDAGGGVETVLQTPYYPKFANNYNVYIRW